MNRLDAAILKLAATGNVDELERLAVVVGEACLCAVRMRAALTGEPLPLDPEPVSRAPKTGAERTRDYRRRHASVTASVTDVTEKRDGGVTESVTQPVTGVTAEGGAGGVALGISGSLAEERSENTEGNTAQAQAGEREAVTPASRATSRKRRDPDSYFDGTADAFCNVIAGGGKHTPLTWGEQDELQTVIGTHAPEGLDDVGRVAWTRATVTEYVTTTEAQYWRRTPKKLGEWLNSRKPKPVAKAAPSTLQGGAGDDWGSYAANLGGRA